MKKRYWFCEYYECGYEVECIREELPDTCPDCKLHGWVELQLSSPYIEDILGEE